MHMKFIFQVLSKQRKLYCSSLRIPNHPIQQNHNEVRAFHFFGTREVNRFYHLVSDSDQNPNFRRNRDDVLAVNIYTILKSYRESSTKEIELSLDQSEGLLTDEFGLDVLNHIQSDWKLVHLFFNCIAKRDDHSFGSVVYNEIVHILGKTRRFEELNKVFDEMSKRKGLVNEITFEVLLHRYVAAHKLDEAIDVYKKWKHFGINDEFVAFKELLMWLCRYKHVEVAETLFYTKKNDFNYDIKTRNIILNGWCVLGNVHEAKRFWKDIVASKCKPDLYTYATFINALTKKGKLGTAMKLFRAMWENGCEPDVVICNCVIDALCFKKRIPEALEIFKGMMMMSERGCFPNVVTYNSLIKHMCKINRMEKVYELVDEMEQKKGECSPNDVTYGYLLKSLKYPEGIPEILKRMKKNECRITGDMYNLILKLYMDWGIEEKVKCTWDEMEKSGLGIPDRRSYTIMIHKLCEKEMIEDALGYFDEMLSKGMTPEPRTEILVNTMKTKLTAKEEGDGETNKEKPLKFTRTKRKTIKGVSGHSKFDLNP